MWLAVTGGGLGNGSSCSVLRVLIAGENNNNNNGILFCGIGMYGRLGGMGWKIKLI